MPELPEVEVWRTVLEAALKDRPIVSTEVLEPSMVDGQSASQLIKALNGAKVIAFLRRGKFLLLRTDRDTHLILHLGMNGTYDLADDNHAPSDARLVLHFEGGKRLAYTSQKKFGLIKLTKDPSAVRALRQLGPEPLDPALTPEVFRRLLAERRRSLKTLLMDQSFLAGIGNVYADEILFQAGLRPDRRASDLSEPEAARLHESLRRVLNEAVAAGADPKRLPAGWITPRRSDDGADCPKCGLPLVHTSFGKRAATFCRKCQK